MMRLVILMSLAVFLAACGADGMPLRPQLGEDVGDQANPNTDLLPSEDVGDGTDAGAEDAEDAEDAGGTGNAAAPA